MTTRIGVQLALIATVVMTIGCDRVTKQVATAALAGEPGRSYWADTVRLVYAENTGGFLSLGEELPEAARTAVFGVGTALILCALAGVAVRYRWEGLPIFGASLVLAGGASNWIDRVVHGRVIDFINVGVGPVRTGIFNVADVGIMLGIGILLLAEIRAHRAASGGV